MTKLSKLKKVDLREVWPKEDKDFTPWLSKHLDKLGDVLGLDLELKEKEASVGADIVAQTPQEEPGIVVIENQYGQSDHDHLGKIITYGSGLRASYVVWICEKIKDEHQTAINRLNETNKKCKFLALEVKLWKIGESKPAPKFEIVCKPDDWGDYIKSLGRREVSETKQLQKRFWEGLKAYMDKEGTFLRPREPKPQGWYSFAIGRSGFKISLTARIRPMRVGCELYISERGSDALKALKKERMEIEKKCDSELKWQELKDKIASRIAQYKKWNIKDEEKWIKIYPWLKEKAETFHKVFSPKVKKLRF